MKVITQKISKPLRTLALGLAHLGNRRPEIFRCLGQVVRRAGLWSFGDAEESSHVKHACILTIYII